MRSLKSKVVALLALSSVFPALVFAQASAIDVSGVVTGLGNQTSSMNLIGGAVLGLLVIAIAYRYVRKVAR